MSRGKAPGGSSAGGLFHRNSRSGRLPDHQLRVEDDVVAHGALEEDVVQGAGDDGGDVLNLGINGGELALFPLWVSM